MEWSGSGLLGAEDAAQVAPAQDRSAGAVGAASEPRDMTVLGWGAALASAAVALFTLGALVSGPPKSWTFEYYPNVELQGEPTRAMRDTPEFLDIRNNLPPGLPDREAFSVRMRSCVEIAQAGVYRFSVRADDGARVLVDGSVLVDAWQKGANKEKGRDITLTEGEHAVTIEYVNRSGPASLAVNMSDAAYRSVRSMKGRATPSGEGGECRQTGASAPSPVEDVDGVEDSETEPAPERDERQLE